MVMVIHEAIGVTEPVIAVDHLGEQRQKGRPIGVIGVDGRPRVAATGHMIDGAWKCEAERSRHRVTVENWIREVTTSLAHSIVEEK